MFLTPRQTVEKAPLDWLNLQRNWWRGTTPPRPAGEPVKPWDNILELTDDWACLPLADTNLTDQASLAAPAVDDAAWQRLPLEAWAAGEELPSHHAFFRKRFRVPSGWTAGEIRLCIQTYTVGASRGRLRVWLDGRELLSSPPKPDTSPAGMVITEACRPGAEHGLAVEVIGEGRIPGLYANTWLAYTPNPMSRQDLAGFWTPSPDALHDGIPLSLPAPLDALMARRSVRVDTAHAGQAVFLHMVSTPGWTGVIINGHYVRRSRHMVGDVTHLNITPWVRFGEENAIELTQTTSGGKGEIKQVALWFYAQDAL